MTLRDGQRLRYDKLIIATGADTHAQEIPGLREHAATIWTSDSMLEVRRRFQQARDAAWRGSPSEFIIFTVAALMNLASESQWENYLMAPVGLRSGRSA